MYVQHGKAIEDRRRYERPVRDDNPELEIQTIEILERMGNTKSQRFGGQFHGTRDQA